MTKRYMARREAKRRHEAEGKTPWRGGGQWQLTRYQFQALYKKVGSFEEAMRLVPHLVVMPVGQPQPPDYVFQDWAYQYESGAATTPVGVDRVLDEKIKAHRMSSAWRTLGIVGGGLETLTQKAAAGELEQATQSQLLSLSNAFNYGMGSIAQLEKVMNGSQPQVHINGRLNINAGPPPPPKIKRKSIREIKQAALAPPVDAEWREVTVDHATG